MIIIKASVALKDNNVETFTHCLREKMKYRNLTYTASATALILILSACGGGGGSSSSTSTSTSSTSGTSSTTTTSTTPANLDFQGTYPAPSVVTYKEKDGSTSNVNAYPGQIEVFFDSTVPATTAISTIEGLGGKIIAQMPDYNYYLVEVKVGSEGTFVSSLRTASTSADGMPHGVSHTSVASVNGSTAAISETAFPVPGGTSSTVIDCFGTGDTHGPLVAQADKDSGGSVGLQVDVSGNNCSNGIENHAIGKSIILTNAANNKVSPGGPVIINISSGGGTNDHDSILDCGSLGAWCTAQVDDLRDWMNILKSKLYFIRAIPAAQRKNLIVTIALGNGSTDVSAGLLAIRQNYPDLGDVLNSNVILVGSEGDAIPVSATRPSGTYSNTADSGEVDVVNYTGLIKDSAGTLVDAGTSFASPRVEAIAEQLFASTSGITPAQVVQAIKRADEMKGGLTLANAKAQAKIIKDLSASGAAVTLSGKIIDSKTGSALQGATVQIVATDGSAEAAYVGFSNSTGTYSLGVPVALRDQTASAIMQVSLAGYVPKAVPVTFPTGSTLTATVNVALDPIGSDTIVVDTALHRIGDSVATTALNAGLQLLSAEGTSMSKSFNVDSGQIPPAYTKATLTYAVNGAECADPVRINGSVVVSLTNSAVGAQALSTSFDIALLKVGSNTLTVSSAASCAAGATGLDDFEISNLIIKLAK